MGDYRNTRYCPEFKNIVAQKQALKTEIENKHQVKDLYTLISPNDGNTFKYDFMRIYNHKCCYCGVQLPIIPKQMFEIDHFRHKKHVAFANTASAGTIDNLVLACRKCNRSKSEIIIDDDDYEKLYPDDGSIAGSFVRDDDYYIEVAPEMQGDEKIQAFYKQLKLNEEVRRLDYLLMNIRGLREKASDKPEIQNLLGKAYDTLIEKRAMM